MYGSASAAASQVTPSGSVVVRAALKAFRCFFQKRRLAAFLRWRHHSDARSVWPFLTFVMNDSL